MKLKLKDCILVGIILSFILIRVLFIHPTFSDETFYFNVGKYVSMGKVPYKDFFFAHPPLQLYILAIIFKIFGNSFWIAKVFSLFSASFCALLTYVISKELYKNFNGEKIGLLSAIIFIVTPAFISFSTMGNGMWETSFLVLLSIFILIKNCETKNFVKWLFRDGEILASIVFTYAVFFRYIALLYFLPLILLLWIKKIRFKKFIIFTSLFIFISLVLCWSIFGQNYINQTVYYHLFSKVSLKAPKYQKMQYFGMGFFPMFIALLSIPVAYVEKDRILFFLAFTPLITDLIMILILKLLFYHYFIISLPFYAIVTGRLLSASKDKIIKIIIPVIVILSIISNAQTIDFYLNPTYANRFYEITDLVSSEVAENETIFGEPVMTNYISFVTDRKIAGNYLDSYLRHLIFENTSKVLKQIEVDKPKVLIEMDNYYMSDPLLSTLFSEYDLEKEITGLPKYFIYKR